MERFELITVQKATNCALKAIVYTAIAELGDIWAVASSQVILQAVGKVAHKYARWVGVAIMVASFADCIWG